MPLPLPSTFPITRGILYLLKVDSAVKRKKANGKRSPLGKSKKDPADRVTERKQEHNIPAQIKGGTPDMNTAGGSCSITRHCLYSLSPPLMSPRNTRHLLLLDTRSG